MSRKIAKAWAFTAAIAKAGVEATGARAASDYKIARDKCDAHAGPTKNGCAAHANPQYRM